MSPQDQLRRGTALNIDYKYYSAPVIPIRRVAPNRGVIHRFPLAPGAPDAYRIISVLEQLSWQYGKDPYVRQQALRVVGDNEDKFANAERLIGFVRGHMVYVPDPAGSEFVISPVNLLRDIQHSDRSYGDCDDHVLLLASMMRALGIDTQIAAVKIFGPDFDHVILRFLTNGRWHDVDPIVKNGGGYIYQERLVTQK